MTKWHDIHGTCRERDCFQLSLLTKNRNRTHKTQRKLFVVPAERLGSPRKKKESQWKGAPSSRDSFVFLSLYFLLLTPWRIHHKSEFQLAGTEALANILAGSTPRVHVGGFTKLAVSTM